MKVLLVSGSYPPMRCGVGDYADRVAAALGYDMEVSVLTSTVEPAAPIAGSANVVRAMSTWRWNRLERFSEEMHRFKPDIIHIQFPTQGYDSWSGLAAIAFLCRFYFRVPVVVTLHEYLPKTSFGAESYIYAMAWLANRIVVVRPEYYDSIPFWLRPFIRKSKIRFIGNASVVPRCELSAAEREAAKRRLGCIGAKLVAFFGFSYPHKGVDLLFEIADPRQHHLLLIGEFSRADSYHAKLLDLAQSTGWKGRVSITGFIGADEAGRLLAAADAVVFPYRTGGGIWNSSLHAAASQDTFVLTTSIYRSGYDPAANIYYARPGDVEEMRRALLDHEGTRGRRPFASEDPWSEIAKAHKEVYTSLIGGGSSS